MTKYWLVTDNRCGEQMENGDSVHGRESRALGRRWHDLVGTPDGGTSAATMGLDIDEMASAFLSWAAEQGYIILDA